MLLNPRIIAFFLAIFISVISTTFLSFVSSVTNSMLFVVALASFCSSFFLVLFTIEILVYREVNKLHRTIQRLKLKDLNISKKIIVQNPNPFKKINQELFSYVSKKQREIDELKKMETYRREFLADVSHELKTPIFAAQGFVHTLLDGAVEDENVRDKFLQKAAKSLDGLDALVKDLMSLSQMEAGETRLDITTIDLRLITLEVCEQLEKKASERNTIIKIKPDTLDNVWVRADEQRIAQVMTNLVDNAIKYGKEDGKIIVHFQAEKKYYIISVIDNGPGIPSEHLPRIFERFYRVDKSRSREKGGTGLGLAIVKHILQLHGSKIKVSSPPNKGTIFSFKLEKAPEGKLG